MPASLSPIHLLNRTVFEYGTVQLDGLSRDKRREVLSALDALPKPDGEDVILRIVHRGEVALQATQFVGLFQIGPLRLQVLPKIYRSNTLSIEARQEAAGNLFVMLRYALDLPVHTGELSALDVGDDWFEAFTTLFTRRLMAEWQRGPVRRYETFQDDLSKVRGRLRVAEHMRRIGRQHVLPVEFDELMADTELNRLFRFVSEHLRRLARTPENIENLRILTEWMDAQGVTLPHAVDPGQVSRLSLDRLQARYEVPLALAKLFVYGDGLLIHEGEQAGLAMFFDMNALFENFLTGVLLEHREEILPSRLREAKILPQGEGDRRPLLFHERMQRGTLYMRPDVLFKNNEKSSLIIDFKYKKLDIFKERLGVSSEDLYQMFAYAQRYTCPEILMIFPHSSSIKAERFINTFGSIRSRYTVGAIDMMKDLKNQNEFNSILLQLKNLIAESFNLAAQEGRDGHS